MASSSSSRWVPPSNRWQHVRPVSHAPLRRPVNALLAPPEAIEQLHGAGTFAPARPIRAPHPVKQDRVPWSSKSTPDLWRQGALREVESWQAQKGACGVSGMRFASTLAKTATLEGAEQSRKEGDIRALRRAVRGAAFLGITDQPEIQRGKALLEGVDQMSVACHNALATDDTTGLWLTLEATRGLDLGVKKWDDPWLAKGLEDATRRWNLAGIHAEKERKREQTPSPVLDLEALSFDELTQMCEKVPEVKWSRKLAPTGALMREWRRRCDERDLICNSTEWLVLMMRVGQHIEDKELAEEEAKRQDEEEVQRLVEEVAEAERVAEAEAEAQRQAEQEVLDATENRN